MVPKNSLTSSSARSTLSRTRFGLPLLLLALALFVYLLRSRIHFDWPLFFTQLHRAGPLHIAAAALFILSTNWIRSWRWTIFLPSTRRVSPFALVGTQFIGFTAVALFGRLADLTRPYLVSRRIDLPIASQIAVYTVERIFDLAAVAILFSTMLFLTPADAPHHHLLVRAGLLALAGTLSLLTLILIIRFAGTHLAHTVQRLPTLGPHLAHKILIFHEGLDTIRSLRGLASAFILSLVMWLLIAEAYVQSTHAFSRTPALATLSLPAIMPLMAASMGGSLIQLPILGWFTQIAITATAMHTLYAAPIEDSTACATVLLIVGTLVVIPIGFLYTRIHRLDLRAVALSSAADEALPSGGPVTPRFRVILARWNGDT